MNIYNWIWKWHFVGGMVCLPIILILSITGTIYLFKEDYEAAMYDEIRAVEVTEQRVSLEQQWQTARAKWEKKPTGVVLAKASDQATQFVSGRFSHKSSLFIDPYSGEIRGEIQQNKTDMHTVRKLHGELLLGSFGTKFVELVACWMVVLLLTGVYLFWPRKTGWKGLFLVRFKSGKRLLFRDLHAVTGFWFSILLLLILAGGLPWTDVFGKGYKWVQTKTDAGFSQSWQGRTFSSTPADKPLPLDDMWSIAQGLELTGVVSIALPTSNESVFSVSNETSDLDQMSVYHFDQYSGELIHHETWEDIGWMMKSRLWVMAFHQGEFGLWNWMLVLVVAVALFFMSVAALVSYLHRKKKGEWSVPQLSSDLNVGRGVVVLVVVLSLLLPLFGVSVLAITLYEWMVRKRQSTQLN